MQLGNKLLEKSIFICFAALALFLTFNRHSKSGYFNYHSEVWADKSGYYVYLPAAVNFNFNPSNFPDSVDSKTGGGFTLDYSTGNIITKYTYGVALLQLPFYSIANVTAKPLGYDQNGFSPIYHWSVNVASVFYLTIGLFFLFSYLITTFDSLSVFLVLFSIFFGTNLYFYSIDETGMSHIYSFSLFCIYLYSLQRTNYLQAQSILRCFLWGILVGSIILIRPTNAVFIIITYLFLDFESKAESFSRFERILSPTIALPTMAGVLLVFIPQVLYWKHTYGSFIHYSYGNEGFNFLKPELIQTWLSPDNGLITYCPLFMAILAGLAYTINKGVKNGIMILGLFLIISYILSSWWDWSYGCSFGARNYIEYMSVFSIPLAHLYQRINQAKGLSLYGFWFFIILCIAFNLKMTYSYDECFGGTMYWDWDKYWEILKRPMN